MSIVAIVLTVIALGKLKKQPEIFGGHKLTRIALLIALLALAISLISILTIILTIILTV